MSVKSHGLGKGIGALISEYDNTSFEVEKLESVGVKVQEIEIDKIKTNPNQPRKTFDPDALMELSQSIQSQGVLQPILVEEIAKEQYVIVAGERRYRASKLAGLKTVPCLIRTFTDVQRMEVSLIENIQRENLNPVEEAQAYQYLLSQQQIKQEDLAKKLGKSRPAIANSLRLLNLPANMLDGLKRGNFSSGHARALLSVENPADREILYKSISVDGISVRQAEKLAHDLNNGSRAVNRNLPGMRDTEGRNKSEEILFYEEKFLSASGCQVEIKGKVTKGKVVIPYTSADELERIFMIFSKGEKLFDSEEEIVEF